MTALFFWGNLYKSANIKAISNITEILLKVALNTIILTLIPPKNYENYPTYSTFFVNV
jgi:hypothetical protein